MLVRLEHNSLCRLPRPTEARLVLFSREDRTRIQPVPHPVQMSGAGPSRSSSNPSLHPYLLEHRRLGVSSVLTKGKGHAGPDTQPPRRVQDMLPDKKQNFSHNNTTECCYCQVFRSRARGTGFSAHSEGGHLPGRGLSREVSCCIATENPALSHCAAALRGRKLTLDRPGKCGTMSPQGYGCEKDSELTAIRVGASSWPAPRGEEPFVLGRSRGTRRVIIARTCRSGLPGRGGLFCWHGRKGRMSILALPPNSPRSRSQTERRQR